MMRRLMRRLKRAWCWAFHRAINYVGGPTYECQACGERREVAWVKLPVVRLDLPRPCSVRRVDGVRQIRRSA
jgi:hypothetical protein